MLAEYGLGEARLSGCHLRRYEAGEAMVRQDEAMDALLFVRSGRAKVCINARNGRHLIICYYISDGVLGDVEDQDGERTRVRRRKGAYRCRVISCCSALFLTIPICG